ncbi:hypothetical protein AwPolaro_01520 [Polaromonas sp.]|nr:hypothetical protein AwPolaro_01520 [Polaromonas sp.]
MPSLSPTARRNLRTIQYSFALGALLHIPAFAAGLQVGIEIPRLNVAEYHKPYVAVWIERADQSVAANLAVWYDTKMKNQEGEKWLKDMRQWWRRTGRELAVPIDGVTSPTRPAGQHQLSFTEGKNPLAKLPAGSYKLFVEASREVGGRELIGIAFDWPMTKTTQLQAQGSAELGLITVKFEPK